MSAEQWVMQLGYVVLCLGGTVAVVHLVLGIVRELGR